MENNSSYVFISYAHKDSGAVLSCIKAMKQNGIRLWFDEGIEAGSEWPEFIAEKVMLCNKFLLFVSRAYLASQNCKRELNFAISRKKDILTIFLEDVELSPGMEMQLGTYQAIYRNRFASDEQFHASLCREHFFVACRSDVLVNSDTVPNPTPTPTPTPTPVQAPSEPTESPTQQPTSDPTITWGKVKNGAYETWVQCTGLGTDSKSDPSAFATPNVALPQKSRMVALVLTLFLGFLGIHKFYLRQPKWGIVYLIFSFTYIPLILSLIEFVLILVSNKEKLMQRYKCILN